MLGTGDVVNKLRIENDDLRAKLDVARNDARHAIASYEDTRRSYEHARDEQGRAFMLLDECRAKKTRLENVLRAILDQLDKDGCVYDHDAVVDEARAVLDGDSAPTEKENGD